MKMEVYVAGVGEETWFRETKDERQVVVLTLLDAKAHDCHDGTAGVKLKQTFDYVPSKEENAVIDLQKLDGETIIFAASEISPGNGRIKMRGKLDRASIPKAALRPSGIGVVSTPPKTLAASA